MPPVNSLGRDHRRWVERFVLVNIAFLSLDIYLAHSVNQFREPAEYLPLYFSLTATFVLAVGFIADLVRPRAAVWRDLGYLVGWLSITIGLGGVVLHLESRFFYERTIKSLVFAAPFAAPLAYTGLGLLLLMNRMVSADSRMAHVGAVVGAGWFLRQLPVQRDRSCAKQLLSLERMDTGRQQRLCRRLFNGLVFYADYAALCMADYRRALDSSGGRCFGIYAALDGQSAWSVTAFVGQSDPSAPPLAPMLFPNLVLLAGIGLFALHPFLPGTTRDSVALSVQAPSERCDEVRLDRSGALAQAVMPTSIS